MKISELIKTLEYVNSTYGDGNVVLVFDQKKGEAPSGLAEGVQQDENIFTNSVGLSDGVYELHIQNFPY